MRPILLVLGAALAAAATVVPASATPPTSDPASGHRNVCAHASAGEARCHAWVKTDRRADPAASTGPAPSAYTPADLRGAYQLGAGIPPNSQTIAIVDAYDNPNAESDLATYRDHYGLAPCTTANGCFRKINQRGDTITAANHPPGNVGWGQEIALDLDMASAICPGCSLLLVEADSNNFNDLGAAVDRAVLAGATVVSNSYGAPEFAGEGGAVNSHYNHPGVAMTVSSGDSGYGVEFPAASQYVTAVGGTTLKWDRARGTRTSETAWSGAGSGCSAYIGKLSWQKQVGTCTKRMVADVAAVADPNTGVSVYDSYGSAGGANWYIFGGTSAAAPIIAGVYALAGNAATVTAGSFPYSARAALFDVIGGTNGRCTTRRSTANRPLCSAVAGWDGPTGLGTPKGAGGF